MVGILNAVMAVVLGLGGAGAKADEGATKPAAPMFVVHFENAATGYPVKATMAFTTKADAEAFARVKKTHGYAVRVTGP